MVETSNLDSAVSGSPWSGPRLLVPVTLQALVVTEDYMGVSASWSILQTNYTNLQSYKVPVDPLPCQTGQLLAPGGQAGQVWTGVVLHWTLPESLRHGTQSAGSPPSNGGAASPPGGEIVYPLIPNRWLVVRTYQNPSGKPNDPSNRVTKSWVLESDDVSTTAPSTRRYHNRTSGFRTHRRLPISARIIRWTSGCKIGLRNKRVRRRACP